MADSTIMSAAARFVAIVFTPLAALASIDLNRTTPKTVYAEFEGRPFEGVFPEPFEACRCRVVQIPKRRVIDCCGEIIFGELYSVGPLAMLQSLEGAVVHSGYYCGIGQDAVAVHEPEAPCLRSSGHETVAEAFGNNLCLGSRGPFRFYVGGVNRALIYRNEFYAASVDTVGQVNFDFREAA